MSNEISWNHPFRSFVLNHQWWGMDDLYTYLYEQRAPFVDWEQRNFVSQMIKMVAPLRWIGPRRQFMKTSWRHSLVANLTCDETSPCQYCRRFATQVVVFTKLLSTCFVHTQRRNCHFTVISPFLQPVKSLTQNSRFSLMFFLSSAFLVGRLSISCSFLSCNGSIFK